MYTTRGSQVCRGCLNSLLHFSRIWVTQAGVANNAMPVAFAGQHIPRGCDILPLMQTDQRAMEDRAMKPTEYSDVGGFTFQILLSR